MKTKIKEITDALSRIKNGDSIMIGGFLQCGHPDQLVDALNQLNVTGLTIISNDTGTTETPSFELIKSGKVTRIMASYIGANPETGRLMYTGEAEVILIPQGTLAEKIRAGGAGLGGFLTQVGIGTIVEEGKQKLTVNDKDYLLELPLKADVALIKADMADKAGNLFISGSARNFNVLMATAAEYTVAQVNEVVEIGDLDADCVTVPGIFVDAIVKI